MNVQDLRKLLLEPDHLPAGSTMTEVNKIEVVFDTAVRFDLELLSVYYNADDGKIHIDVD